MRGRLKLRKQLAKMPAMQALENSRLFYFEQMEELYWTHVGVEMSLSRLTGDPFPLWQAIQQWKAVSLSETMSRGLTTSIEDEAQEIDGLIEVSKLDEPVEENLRQLVDQFSTFEPLSEDDVYSMAEIAKEHLEAEESIIFVDWARYYDTLFVTAFNGTTSALKKGVIEYDYSTIQRWVQDNLGVENLQQGQITRKRLRNIEALDELRPILEPLESFIKPNDLVVLCPAGILHALPMHAIPFGSEGKPFIVANPIVYSPSQTLLWRCTSQSARFTTTRLAHVKAIAMVRLGGNDPREETRMEQVALSALQYLPGSEVTAGRAVTKENFVRKARGANVLHYHGHAYLDVDERKNRALVLEKAGGSSSPEEEHLTVMDIFGLGLEAAVVVLLACASGEDDIAPNDDPLGMLSAFFYAGANSVIATLWPTQTSDARAFAEKFYARAFGPAANGTQERSSIFLAKALQDTVRELWEAWDEDEPYHWAQFELREYTSSSNT
jgi:CHAT domain-containing protein